ncbi:MAG: peptide chain release factor 2 [Armatimonadetes bacterium]|nr:peptide chain release factor 2 [Armatimonadota bacterium]
MLQCQRKQNTTGGIHGVLITDAPREIKELRIRLEQIRTIFDVESKANRIRELEQISAQPGFWDNPDEAQSLMTEMSRLKGVVDPYGDIRQRIDDLEVMSELVAESDEESDQISLQTEYQACVEALEAFEMQTFLSGPHDESNAIVEINSGAGGTESCDWAAMLLRMYLRWAERRGFQTEILSEVEGEVAGIKNATFLVKGPLAYGYLKVERGVHRLVRISPFDSNARRHTSFASVDVVPEITDGPEIQINPDDLRVDTYRSSGAGGQHVNKTDSAVRITHIPTGIVVSCQNERSQHQNREVAMRILASKLWEVQRQEEEARLAELRGEQRKIEWGNQIRSYVFQPYQMVKDLRTDFETSDVQGVMDGELDAMIERGLRAGIH